MQNSGVFRRVKWSKLAIFVIVSFVVSTSLCYTFYQDKDEVAFQKLQARDDSVNPVYWERVDLNKILKIQNLIPMLDRWPNNYSEVCVLNFNQFTRGDYSLYSHHISFSDQKMFGKMYVGIKTWDGQTETLSIPRNGHECVKVKHRDGDVWFAIRILSVGVSSYDLTFPDVSNSVIVIWPGFWNQILLAGAMFLALCTLALLFQSVSSLFVKTQR